VAIGDDHETRIGRLEFRMDIMADKLDRDSSERKEEYAEIIRELKALRAETNRQQGRQEQKSANMKIAGVVIGMLGLLVALGWLGSAESYEAVKRETEDESERTRLVIESPPQSEPR